MNLVEKLMAVDKKEFDKFEKKELVSRQLSNLLGTETKVTIQVIDGNLYGALSASGLNEDGKYDYSRGFDTNAKIAAAGIVDPNLKDDALLKHLGVATPADAAKKIFKGEVFRIATEISELSGFQNDKETDEEVKNSSEATEK